MRVFDWVDIVKTTPNTCTDGFVMSQWRSQMNFLQWTSGLLHHS